MPLLIRLIDFMLSIAGPAGGAYPGEYVIYRTSTTAISPTRDRYALQSSEVR